MDFLPVESIGCDKVQFVTDTGNIISGIPLTQYTLDNCSTIIQFCWLYKAVSRTFTLKYYFTDKRELKFIWDPFILHHK